MARTNEASTKGMPPHSYQDGTGKEGSKDSESSGEDTGDVDKEKSTDIHDSKEKDMEDSGSNETAREMLMLQFAFEHAGMYKAQCAWGEDG